MRVQMNKTRELDKFCRLLEFINAKVSLTTNGLESNANDSELTIAISLLNSLGQTNMSNLCLSHRSSSSELYEYSYKFNYNSHNQATHTSNLVEYNLIKYVYPILLIFGLIGNFVSFVAMLKRYTSERSAGSSNKSTHMFSFSLAILCFVDFGVLVVACMDQYVEQTFEFSLRATSEYSCKALYFSCYLFRLGLFFIYWTR